VEQAAPTPELGVLDDLGGGEPGLAGAITLDDDATPKARSDEGRKREPGRAADSQGPIGAALSEPLAVAEAEVLLLARYGEAPVTLFASLGYAVRVVRRRRELARLFTEVRREEERQRRLGQGELATLLDAVRQRHDDHEGVRAVVRPIDDARLLIANRAHELDLAQQRHQAQSSQLDAELALRAEDRERLLGERRGAQVALEDATHQHARVKGELGRLDRDLTMAHDAASKAAGDSEFAPPEHARRITELQGKQASAKVELSQASRVLADAQARVAAFDRQLKEVDGRVADTHARRRALDHQALVARDRGAEAIKIADHHRLDLGEAALRLLVEQHPELFGVAEVQRFEAVLGAMRLQAREVEKHRLAVDAYDKEAMKRGLLLAICIVVGLGVLAFALSRLRIS
jgi:hypothetical protein